MADEKMQSGVTQRALCLGSGRSPLGAGVDGRTPGVAQGTLTSTRRVLGTAPVKRGWVRTAYTRSARQKFVQQRVYEDGCVAEHDHMRAMTVNKVLRDQQSSSTIVIEILFQRHSSTYPTTKST